MATSKKSMTEEEWQLLENIGEMFKGLRDEAGLTQQQAARSIGMHQSRVPVLENGQADVMVTTLHRWANLYGYSVEIRLVPVEDEFDKALREAVESFEEKGGDAA